LGQWRAASRERRMFDAREAARREQPREIVGQLFGDEGARALAAGQVALGRELLVGEERGRAREAEIVGERARGRNPLTRRDDAVEDGLPDAGVDLLLQAEPRSMVDSNEQAGWRHRTGGSLRIGTNP